MSTSALPTAAPTQPTFRGYLVEFDSPGALISAAEQVRDAGFTKWDTHSPFPVHGIDAAMGIRPTRLPWIIFLFGVVGCGLGVLLQWWTNAANPADYLWLPNFLRPYDFFVSGKPDFSLPANIPVIFEMTVLFAALAAVFGMLAMNNLPRHHNPLFDCDRFRRVTADRFYLFIQDDDPKFDAQRTKALLDGLGGIAVESVLEQPSPNRWPTAITIGTIIVVCLALFPPLLVARARVALSREPRIHLVQDMDNQERFKAQQANPYFADARADRPPIEGTVARTDPIVDTPLLTGKTADGAWLQGYPPELTVTDAFVKHGQVKFNVYCAPCHGLGGFGDGTVPARAMELDTEGYVQPTSMHDQVVLDRENGHIFNTITNGIRSMPPYGSQIPPKDRWAIISYVRALELSQRADLEDVPTEVRPTLR